MTTGQFRYLLNRWLLGTINQEEAGQLMEKFGDPRYQHIVDEFLEVDYRENNFSGFSSPEMKVIALQQLEDKIAEDKSSIKPVRRIHLLKTAWFRYAAVIVFLIMGAAIFYQFYSARQSAPALVQNVPTNTNDIAPGFKRAVLTLSSGQKLELDSAASKTIQDGNLSIENTSGHLIYRKGHIVAMNTMATPKGGQYQLTLADGTKVWLNAASSITYPTAFLNGIREVTITGEAYFEVKANPQKPFVVKTPREVITVLGTNFNINAYANESESKTSLLQGVIKVDNTILRPGQAYKNGNLITTNTAQDIAWKNGVFDFDRIELHEAMKQLERWYDIEVEFSRDVADLELRGQIGRELTLQQIVKGLEDKNLRFILNNRVLTVTK